VARETITSVVVVPAESTITEENEEEEEMPVQLQSCGKKSAKRNWIWGPNAPANAVFLNCTHLPNPYGRLQEYNEPRELDAVKKFLRDNAPDKLDRLVERGKKAVEAGKPVVAQCMYGKHRSRAVLELIGDSFHCSKVYYVHREGP